MRYFSSTSLSKTETSDWNSLKLSPPITNKINIIKQSPGTKYDTFFTITVRPPVYNHDPATQMETSPCDQRQARSRCYTGSVMVWQQSLVDSLQHPNDFGTACQLNSAICYLAELTAVMFFILMHGTFYQLLFEHLLCTTSSHVITTTRHGITQDWVSVNIGRRNTTDVEWD